MECRQVLDGLLARKAAQNATDGQIGRLRANRERMQRAVADQEVLEYSALLQEHHRLVREAARQHFASALVERLQGRLGRHLFQLLLRPGRAAQSLAELTEVVDAITERRPDSAESAARANVQAIIDTLLLESAGE
jgi:DNA-binding GntR family transcriptional regulator